MAGVGHLSTFASVDDSSIAQLLGGGGGGGVDEWGYHGAAGPGDEVLVEWAGSCAVDTHDYQKLYVHVPEGTLPVAPIQLD